jgi:hypothetical protein
MIRKRSAIDFYDKRDEYFIIIRLSKLGSLLNFKPRIKINVIGFYNSRNLVRVKTRASRGTNAINKYNKGFNIDFYREVESRGLFYIRLKASLIYNVVNMENNIST